MTKVCLSFPIAPKLWVTEKIYEQKYVTLGDVTQGKLLILLLHAWVQAKANLFAHCLLHYKGIGIVTTRE
jgi:hypothetical protein